MILTTWYDKLTTSVGSLPARRVTWGLVFIFSIWVLLDIFVLKFTHGLTHSSYDAMVRARLFVAAPDPRLIIIDIDEASLARMGKEFGRWPWPRDTLATVLDYVERQQPAAVVWDILFSDVDRLNPGGDAAFNEAAKRSQHSHFAIVRLPKANDAASQITRTALPGLWVESSSSPQLRSAAKEATVALIPPALPALASGRLGFNNGYVDADGMLRRYRYTETLDDGSMIQSIPMSVFGTVSSVGHVNGLPRGANLIQEKDELISWRKVASAYPHVSFADVFAQAEGDMPRADVPTFAGKIIIVGATAPSLHDIHATPLSSTQAGVDSLATVLDNALNQRHMHELPHWLQAALAIALCAGLALWVQVKSAASLAPALLALPTALMAISYLSLNGLPVFLDLHLSAGLALLFLSVLGYWNKLRRDHWCSPPVETTQPLSIWAWERNDAWGEGALDRLIDAVERYAPDCRVVLCDANKPRWSWSLRWPELARFAALVGPQESMQAALHKLEPALRQLAQRSSEPVLHGPGSNREHLAKGVFLAWAALGKVDTNNE